MFLASLWKKLHDHLVGYICKWEEIWRKIEGEFANGKKFARKKEEIWFCWELNSKPFVMAEVGKYLENRSNGF